MRFVWTILFCLLCAPAMAMDNMALADLPIQHNGRIKPLSSFARHEYGALTDRAFVTTNAAIDFLTEALFDPAAAAERDLISIRNQHVKSLLGLDAEKKRFALTDIVEPLMKHERDIAAWLQQNPDTLDIDQRALIGVYDDVVGLTQIMRSFTSILPLADSLPPSYRTRYDLPNDRELSFLDLQPAQERIQNDVKGVLKSKGDNPENYTSEERALAYVSWQIDELREAGIGNARMRLLPTGWDENWLSPWQMLLSGRGSPGAMSMLQDWQDAAFAWRNNDEKSFDIALDRLRNKMDMRSEAQPLRLALERLYDELRPVGLSFLLYAAALIAYGFGRVKILHSLAFAAIFVHGLALVLRVAILARPPVGTLFESILFAGFIAVLAGCLWARKMNKAWLVAAIAAMGAALQLTALGFTQNGDTLQPLQAVLNTPFWLATHVIIITAGYGVCLLTALLAHAGLVLKLLRKEYQYIVRAIAPAAMVALLLTSVGTILGGLWADQSWGRFWGWDPKENGALLIVLWLSWIMHARLSGHVKENGYMAGMAALGIVVALAWFGVNLLSTGLHSYGFINGIATGLFSYLFVQTALIAALWWKARAHA